MEITEQDKFESQLNYLREHKDYGEFPGLDISMYPEDIGFLDDLSNKKYYNDVFIEHRVDQPSGFRYLIKIMFFAHNIFIFMAVDEVFSGLDFRFSDLFFLSLWPAMAWFFLMFEIGRSRFGGVRFNRQAQLVHVGGLEGVVTVPWRSVKPFFNHGIQGALKLYFPEPSVAINKHNQSVKCYERTLSKDPYGIDGTMDWRDVGLNGSLRRLEFYRRYMEQGLDAVQPDPDKVGEAAIRPPSEAQQSHPEHGFMLHWVIDPIAWLGSLLAGGPLIDWFLRKQAEKFQWPQEIERLCSPGADLSGYDTTPVRPRANIFYRPRGLSGIEVVNANGLKIP